MKKVLKTVVSFALLATILMATACTGAGEETKGTTASGKEALYANEIDVTIPVYELPSGIVTVADHLTKAPNYELPAGATLEQRQQMAVQVMLDMNSFNWTPVQRVFYEKSVGSNDRDFEFLPQQIVGGLPYTAAALSIFHTMEYYDFNTGYLYGIDWTNAGGVMGNSCAAAVNWAIASISPNMAAVSTSDITPTFGYQPVGNYEWPGWRSYQPGNSTAEIIEILGEDGIMEAYASMHVADALDSCQAEGISGHCMMVQYAPVVVRKEDGSVDPDESYVLICDQWSTGEKTKDSAGIQVQNVGRHDIKYTFSQLRKQCFIPMRAVDLADDSEYVEATAKINKEINSLADLKGTKVECNYRVVKIQAAIISESGKTVYLRKKLTDRVPYTSKSDRIQQVSVVIPQRAATKVLQEGLEYTCEVSVLMANGKNVVVASFPISISDLE